MARREHPLFGTELIKALVEVGAIPEKTIDIRLLASSDDYVTVEGRFYITSEQWAAVGTLLPKAPTDG